MASTQQQQQNFRKTYYSSLGVKAVEVQPSLDAALKGSELQAEKLQRLCLWVRIPSLYRPLVWRVLLGALPPLKEAWADVEAQQDIEWAELQSCLSATDFGKGADELTARRLLQSVLLSLLPAEEGHSWSLYQITGSSMSLMHEYGDVPAVSCPYLVSLSQACLSIGAGPLETFVLLRGLLCKLDVPLWPRPEDEKKRISQTTARIDLMRSLLKEHDLEVSSKLESLGIDLIAACGACVFCMSTSYLKLKYNTAGLKRSFQMSFPRKRSKGIHHFYLSVQISSQSHAVSGTFSLLGKLVFSHIWVLVLSSLLKDGLWT